jgi:hypothetical protein
MITVCPGFWRRVKSHIDAIVAVSTFSAQMTVLATTLIRPFPVYSRLLTLYKSLYFQTSRIEPWRWRKHVSPKRCVYLRIYMASLPRRTTSYSPQWEHEVSHINGRFGSIKGWQFILCLNVSVPWVRIERKWTEIVVACFQTACCRSMHFERQRNTTNFPFRVSNPGLRIEHRLRWN